LRAPRGRRLPRRSPRPPPARPRRRPAPRARSAVLADIGDSQSISANLSTFSGHLRRIQALRQESDSKSLVLLDELGTGTDPEEGAALGLALLRRLAAGGPGGAGLTVATTHMGLLTTLKYEDPAFENVSVEFDEESLRPTYRLLWGVPGRSNALHIASRLGLDEAVVSHAAEMLGESYRSEGAVLAEMEAVRAAMLAAEAEAGEEEGRLRVAEARRAAAESAGRDRVRGEAAKASRDIAATLRRARAQLGRAASPAPRAPAPAAPAAPAAPEAPAPEAPAPGTGWVPSVGDAVVVSQMGKRGKVMGVQGKGAGATCTVQVGLLQVKASPGELRKA